MAVSSKAECRITEGWMIGMADKGASQVSFFCAFVKLVSDVTSM
jgi:hypothetical protein